MMETIGLVMLAFLAQTTHLLAVPVFYQYVNEMVGWFEAAAYCREHFYDLAIINNAEQWARVQDIVSGTDHFALWIGIWDDFDDVWRWSLHKGYLDTSAGSWFAASLTNTAGSQACGYLLQGTVYDASCTNSYKSVCYDERFDSYIPVTAPMTWYDAQRYCKDSYTDLSSIRDQQELQRVMSVTDSSEWWVGLFRHNWVWSDHSISWFRAWGPGEPNYSYQRCVAASVDGWLDFVCSDQVPFICSVARRTKVVKVWLKAPASLNLSDPKILEDLANQMENHMINQQIQQSFKLMWRKQVHGNVFS